MATRKKTKNKTSLAIVERAFRGAIEEQYGHIVWLSRVIRKMGGQTSLLLRGNAVLFAAANVQPLELRVGDVVVKDLPHYETTLGKMAVEGVPLYAFRPDCDRLGISRDRLIPEIKLIDEKDLSRLCAEHDCVWYW